MTQPTNTTTTTAAAPTETSASTLEHLDPASLVIDANVRSDPRLDPHFVASVRERGVLEPVVAYRDEHGQVVVQYGQRRTLAAQQVERPTIPVLLSRTPPATVDRLVDQWVENEHRAALTGRERVEAVAQMTLAGLSVGQIAKRTATPRKQVEAAAAASASQAATQAADTLTLDQAATVAEFDDDDDAVATLVAAAEQGRGFDHAVQRLRDDRAESAALARAAAALAETGVTVVDKPSWNDETTLPLDRLRDADANRVDPETHATCPGNVAWVTAAPAYRYAWNGGDEEDYDDEADDESGDEEGPQADEPEVDLWPTRVTVGCTGWAEHGHTDAYASRASGHGTTGRVPASEMTDEQRETAKASRRHTIASNKDWKAATQVRKTWLRQFAQRKTAPIGTEVYLARQISDRRYQPSVEAHDLAGYSQAEIAHELTTATPKRALHLALVLALASWESGLNDGTWRDTYGQPEHAAALTALAGWGYDLSDIEARIVAGTAHQPA